MSAPAKVHPRDLRSRIPGLLLSTDAWVGHRSKKPLMLPDGKRAAKTNAPKTWRPFSDALAFYERTIADPDCGVGFVLQRLQGVVFLDFDKCLDEGGALLPWAAPLVAPFLCRTYVERSQSGRGLHVLCLGSLAGPHNLRPEGAGDGHVEFYCDKRFVALTGDLWAGAPAALAPMQAEVDALLAALGARPAGVPGADRGPEPERAEEVAAMLACLDPDMPHDDWIETGMAAKAGLGDAGLAIWDAWSSRGQKYVPGEPARRWASFQGSGITLGTLVDMARKAGWKGRHTTPEEDFAGFAEGRGDDGGDRVAVPADGDIVHVADQDRFVLFGPGQGVAYEAGERRTGWLGGPVFLTKDGLNTYLAREKFALPSRRGQMVAVKPATYYAHVGGRALRLVWFPGRPRVTTWKGQTMCNTFAPPRPVEPGAGGDAASWLEHAEYIIPNREEREHFLDVLAYNVQHLDGKVNHALVLGGQKRIGKDLLLHPIRLWLNEAGQSWRDEYYEMVASGSFDYAIYQAKFLCVQEAKALEFTKRHAFYNKMKQYIASPPDELTVNLKNLHQFQVPNVLQMIFLTNYEDGVFFEDEDDGRYYVVWSDAARRPDAYYRTFGAWVERCWPAVVGWLMARDLSRFEPKAALPETTDAKRAMHEATRLPAEREMAELLRAYPEGVFSRDLLREHIKSQTSGRTQDALLALLGSGSRLRAFMGNRRDWRRFRTTEKGDQVVLWYRAEIDEAQARARYDALVAAEARRRGFRVVEELS